jgi:hypothetical protein
MVTWCDPRIRVGHEKTRIIWWTKLGIISYTKGVKFIWISL